MHGARHRVRADRARASLRFRFFFGEAAAGRFAPHAAGSFQNTTCPIIQFPLDMTNQAAITTSFMNTLQAQAQNGSRYSELAFQSYQLVAAESFYVMWDVVTTCWLANQSFFQPPAAMNLAIDATLNNTQGCIKPAPDGRAVQVVLNFSASGQQAFYDYVAGQLNRSRTAGAAAASFGAAINETFVPYPSLLTLRGLCHLAKESRWLTRRNPFAMALVRFSGRV